jgi:hypothetical protein
MCNRIHIAAKKLGTGVLPKAAPLFHRWKNSGRPAAAGAPCRRFRWDFKKEKIMSVMNQRAFTRNNFRAPIYFSDPAAEDYHEGEMVNSSVGGMGFVAARELKPGDGILIQMADMAPDPYWPEARRDYFAEVRWCEKKDDAPAYQVGVRFMVETCRLCDATIYHASSDDEHICEHCRKRVCSLTDGTIKECIEKYLMGNVL